MMRPRHIPLGELPRAFECASAPRDTLGSPAVANDLLATIPALARETAVSDALLRGKRHRLSEAPRARRRD
jgi:hypothetical protein